MNRVLFVFVATMFASPALACEIAYCALPDSAHLESERFKGVPDDDWAWMNHDLARARAALATGETERATQIVGWLDHALRVRAVGMVDARGKSRVKAFERALRQIQRDAGGPPLARLQLGRPVDMPTENAAETALSTEPTAEPTAPKGVTQEDQEEGAERARREIREDRMPEPAPARHEVPEREGPRDGPR